MVINALFAALHFLAAFGVVATLLIEWLLFKPQLSYAEARIMVRYYGGDGVGCWIFKGVLF